MENKKRRFFAAICFIIWRRSGTAVLHPEPGDQSRNPETSGKTRRVGNLYQYKKRACTCNSRNPTQNHKVKDQIPF